MVIIFLFLLSSPRPWYVACSRGCLGESHQHDALSSRSSKSPDLSRVLPIGKFSKGNTLPKDHLGHSTRLIGQKMGKPDLLFLSNKNVALFLTTR